MTVIITDCKGWIEITKYIAYTSTSFFDPWKQGKEFNWERNVNLSYKAQGLNSQKKNEAGKYYKQLICID